MLFIYIPKENARIKYVFNYIFGTYLNIPFQIISDATKIEENQPLISYKTQLPNSVIHFEAHPLLFETGIQKQEIECFEYNNHIAFFKVDDKLSNLPYDPFALTFYMLSRYEEYHPTEKDEHGRFKAKDSLAFKNNFLEEPIVDQAIVDIKQLLQKHFPELKFKEKAATTEVSYDVDAPFAYRGKGFFTNFFGSFKMLATGHFQQGMQRLVYCLAGGKDPFDQFFDILLLLDEANLSAHFFLLLEHEGEHNPSIKFNHYAYDILVDRLSRYQETGIHPSYNCTDQKLKKELSRYKTLLGETATKARSHFIQLSFPETYQMYLENGITDDYSMGFPELPGFRAGIARSFPFYDLKNEIETKLTIHPFIVMDATFEYYLTLLSEDAIELNVKKLWGKVKQYNGQFNMIFHNDIVSNHLSQKDWKYLHEKIIWDLRQDLSNDCV